jgi:1-acyl-sn-glycerol-3-phosphate acyltransferase
MPSAAESIPPTMNGGSIVERSRWTDRIASIVGEMLRRYHRHQAVGLAHLRAALDSRKPVLLVGNHSMDAIDPLMLRTAIHAALGRSVPFIGHELIFFRLPGLRSLMQAAGVIPSRDPELAERTLRDTGVLALYPGAGSEAALRLYRREPYRLKWYGRQGFVELALRTRATILFVAGIGIDELFFQTNRRIPSSLFRWVEGTNLAEYRGMRLQLGPLGLHVLPTDPSFPVRVTHVISPPIHYDENIDPLDRAGVEKTHVHVWASCQRFLDEAIASRDRHSDALDAACRRAMRLLEEIGL